MLSKELPMNYPMIFSLLGLLMMGQIKAQDTFEIPLSRGAIENVHISRLPEGKLMFIRRSEPTEVMLLDKDFEVEHSVLIKGRTNQASWNRTLGTYLGIRNTPTHYILHFEVPNRRPYVELIKLDKATFEMERQQYFFVPRGYRPVRSFILRNEFFSISRNNQEEKLRILRTFGDEDTWSYTFDMNKRVLRNLEGRYYLDRKGELFLKLVRRDSNSVWDNPVYTSIIQFPMDRAKPGASEYITHFSGHLGRTTIRDNYLYSFGVRRDSMRRPEAVMVDIYDFESMKPVASLSSEAKDSTKSIKPDVLYERKILGVLRDLGDSVTDERDIMRIINRSSLRFWVQEEADHIEMTLGFYLENGGLSWKWPSPSFFEYRVKLDKETFQSLGKSYDNTPIGEVTRYIAENRLDGTYSFRTYEMFWHQGDFYFGYQPRRKKKYVFKKFTPDGGL